MNTRLILAMVLLAFGSQTYAAKKISQPSPAELVATHGYVYVVLPKNKYDKEPLLGLKRVGDKAALPLTKRPDVTGDAYGAWLPAGEYELAKWDIYTWDKYLSITVKSGQVTDLGAMIPVPIGAYKFVVVPVRPQELVNRVRDVIEEFKTILASTETLQWLPTETPKPFKTSAPSTGLGLVADLLMSYDRKVNKPSLNVRLGEAATISEFMALAKTVMPPLADQSASDDQGNLYFGADLGQVRVRTPTGNWSSLDVGTIESITAVAVVGGKLFAGSGNGALFASTDQGASWSSVVSLSADEEIANIHRVGNRWLITTLRSTLERNLYVGASYFKLYTMEGDDFTQLKVNRENKMPSPIARWFWPGPAATVSNDTYYLSNGIDLLRLNLATMEWKVITPPAFFQFNVSRKNGLIAAYSVAGMFSKLFVSTDQGNNWTKRSAPPYVIRDVYFDDADTGRAVRDRAGAFLVTKEMLNYDSTKDRWVATRDAPQGCTRILHDHEHQPKFCLTNGGSILNGEGSEWIVEFSAE